MHKIFPRTQWFNSVLPIWSSTSFVFHTRDRKMALLQMSTVEEAIQALIDLHSYDMGRGHRLRVSFSKSTIWGGSYSVAYTLFLTPAPYGVLSDIRVHLNQLFLKTTLETCRHHYFLSLSFSLPVVTHWLLPQQNVPYLYNLNRIIPPCYLQAI